MEGSLSGEYDATATHTFVDIVIEGVSATHLHDVKPAAVAQTGQRSVQGFDRRLLTPLVGDEDLW